MAHQGFKVLRMSVLRLCDVIYMPYPDDILCYFSTFGEHSTHLRTLFQRLRQRGIKLKPEKYNFFRK